MGGAWNVAWKHVLQLNAMFAVELNFVYLLPGSAVSRYGKTTFCFFKYNKNDIQRIKL